MNNLYKLFFSILIAIFVSNFVSAEELKSIGKFKDWESFVLTQDGNKICFAQSKPVLRAPKN